MRKDVVAIKPLQSSFLSCEKDAEIILKKLFVDSKPYSDKLKRLLIINNPDCLDENVKSYKEIIDSKNLATLRKEGYIKFGMKIARGEHEELKSYLLLSFDNFTPNTIDPSYRDCMVYFDIVCPDDAWELDNYKVRPFIIAGYIDGILNSLTNTNKKSWQEGLKSNIKMSGMGEYYFMGLNQYTLNEDFSIISLMYKALHFTDDIEKVN